MSHKALELRFIEADIREELLGTLPYLFALSIHPDKSSWKNSLHLPLLAEPTGGLFSILGRALIPWKGLCQAIQNRLQAPFPTTRLAVCNISRRRKGDDIAACWVRSNIFLNFAASLVRIIIYFIWGCVLITCFVASM